MTFHPRVAQVIGSALAREMEMALAPVAGTRLLAPFRMLVVSSLANL